MSDIRVAFWNLENLFDQEDAVRDPILAKTLRRELAGWTAAIRDAKIGQLAKIIRSMFGGEGPDLLGVAEVENEAVLQLLGNELNIAGRDYRVLGHDSPDARGIDVSFLFDANTLTASNPQHQVVVKRTATRDVFWADFTVQPTGSSFTAVANHWPSRSAGQYESEPFRLLTGETVSFVLDELLDDEKPILLMGDFNDEPFNRSMQEYLLGTRDRESVASARSAPRVWNLMWPMMSDTNPGTHRFRSTWNMLDQFLVSRGMLLEASDVNLVSGSVEIFRPPEMLGTGSAPRRFGRPSATLDTQGFSDHFPITVRLKE